MRSVVALACVALLGCSGLYTNPDSGNGGGAGGSGGGAAGGSGGSGGGSGGSGGGGTGGSGGGTAGGTGGSGGGFGGFQVATLDAGAFTRTEVMFTSPPDEYLSIAGLSENQYLVGDGSGRITAWDNGTTRVVYTDPGNFDLNILQMLPSGETIASSNNHLAFCAGNCFQTGTFQNNFNVPSGQSIGAACLGNGVAFAVSTLGSTNTLHEFHGASWADMGTLPGPTTPESCIVLADGTLIITGSDDALRRDADGGTAVEAIPNSAKGGLSPYWWGTTLYQGEVWAAGQGRRLARRSSSGTWTIVYEGNDLYRFHGIGASGGTLVTAGDDDSPVHNRAVVENNTVFITADPQEFYGRGVFVPSPNVHIVVGFQNPATVSEGKIYKFTR
jgi:hypothetical protein